LARPNIAEGNGKRSYKDRNRYLDLARGPSLEGASTQANLPTIQGIDDRTRAELKHRAPTDLLDADSIDRMR
jgi:hypothetical protein